MNHKKLIILPLILFSLSSFSFATIYSDAEDGTVGDWYVKDNKPAGATISNIMDSEKNSHVIEFKGAKRTNAYMLGAKKGAKAWNNSKEIELKWSMNFSEKFKIVVYVETKKGKRSLIYDYKEDDKGLYKKRYIKLGLGKKSMSGTWQSFSRDLHTDVGKYESDNKLLTVYGFKVQGSGKIDDVELFGNNGNPEKLEISDVSVEKKSDTSVKVHWKLNHKGTGQVEYGTTTNYGELSKKENSFNYSSHSQTLRNLASNTTYHYRTISEDEAGNRATSEDKTFSTGGDNNNVLTFKQWDDIMTSNDGKKVQVSFKANGFDGNNAKYQLIFKDLDSSTTIYTHNDVLDTEDNDIEKTNIFIDEKSKKLYLFTYYDSNDENTYVSHLTIYNINNINAPSQLSRIDLDIAYNSISILNDHQFLLMGWNGDWDANPCDKDDEFAKTIDVSNASQPILSEDGYRTVTDSSDLNQCEDYFNITGKEGNYLDIFEPKRRIELHGKPYGVIRQFTTKLNDYLKTTFVAIGDKGVEEIDYTKGVSIQVIPTDISVKNIAIITNKLLVFNDDTYQYIDIP